MSGEGMQKTEKRSKELKSSKAVIENGDLDREEKKTKDKSINKLAANSCANSELPEKKKKKKDAVISVEKNNVSENAIETESKEKSRKEKKKKKKHREEFESMSVDVAVSVASGESEKKKRKREQAEDELIPDVVTTDKSESKREHKEKKRRKTDPSFTSTESSCIPSKAASPHPKSSTSTVISFSASGTATPEEAKSFLKKHSITIHTPKGAPNVTPVIRFSQLKVPSEIQSAFTGFKEPTPIQACTWPAALEGRDVVGIAETGSGKTLAFGIPALCHLLVSSKPKSNTSSVSVLVVAPTRELALQTHDILVTLGKPFGITSVAVFGGVPKEPQVKMLKNANKAKDGLMTRIIVGTPGRILDLMQEGACDLSGVDYLVLDEADRMLDKGFENDIRNIISSTKPMHKRQTMMFSATWPEAVRRLASTFQRDPVRVTVGSEDLTANSCVEQSVEVFDDARSKDQRLLNVLKSLSHKKKTTSAEESRVLVFALYKKEASRVEQMLRNQGYSVGALHGDMSQNTRLEALDNFKTGKTGLMVATDVAARGLDIPNVSAVINYTFPLTIEDYIHRIGRTGRAGKSGRSITFFTGDVHEKSLAGEFARVLREGGFDYEALKKFPMTIKKREHSAYGAFYREDIPVPKGPTKIVF